MKYLIRLILFAALIGLCFAQKPHNRPIENADWMRMADTNLQNWDYTRGQFLNTPFTMTNTYNSGSFSLKIVDTFRQVNATAHKSIWSELTYTPVTAGTACPIAIVGKVNLNGDLTAANAYSGMGWGVQGQMNIVTGSTIDGSTYGSPGAVYAGIRGVVTDGSGSSTYTKGILAGVYAEIQMNEQDAEDNADFDIYGIYIRNQGVTTSPDLTAGLYMDANTVQGGANFEIGVDINDAVVGMDIDATTTGIDFSGSMTQEIIGQNDEIMSNANDGEWDFGIAKIATTGSGRGTDQYEFVFDVTNRSGGIFPNGGPYKTYIYNAEVDREADEDATGDSRDVMFKGVYRNYGQNAVTLHVQGIGTTLRNESGGTLGSMKGGEFSVNNKIGATVDGALYGITATVENYATPGSDIIAGLFEIRNEGTNATAEYGIQITNTNNSQADAADAAIYIDNSGANIGWGYGLDMSGATIQTAEIRGQNDETIDNTANGSWDFGDADLIMTGGDLTGANGNAIDIGEAVDGTFVFSRDDSGAIILTSADNDANADLTIVAGGSGSLLLGDTGGTVEMAANNWSVNTAGKFTGTELRAIHTTSTDVSALPIYVSETLSGDFGLAATPAYGMTVYSKILGDDLTATDAYEAAITGLYGITGTNASVYPKAGILGWIADNTTTADGAFIALIDGDNEITQAGAAYGVRYLNSTPTSGFDYGLDLYSAAILDYAAVSYRTADIRLSDASMLDVDVTNGSTLESPTNVTVLNYVGAINQTVITLSAHVMTITDAAAAGAHGSLKLITFPEGHIRLLSAHQVLTTLAGSGGIDDDAILDVGVGSITTSTGNDELAGTEQEITGKKDVTLSSGTLLFDTINATPQTLDGSASAEDAWLNVAIKEDDVDASDTLIITGTITINWMFMGND